MGNKQSLVVEDVSEDATKLGTCRIGNGDIIMKRVYLPANPFPESFFGGSSEFDEVIPTYICSCVCCGIVYDHTHFVKSELHDN